MPSLFPISHTHSLVLNKIIRINIHGRAGGWRRGGGGACQPTNGKTIASFKYALKEYDLIL